MPRRHGGRGRAGGHLALDSYREAAEAVARDFGIRMVAGPIPAFTLSLGILFTLLFPLGRENYREITRQLEERRKAARERPT